MDISIKQTLLLCTNGDYFTEIPLWLLKRDVEFSQILVLVNFFSLNFTSIEIKGKRTNSSQNELPWGWWGCSKTNKGEQGGVGGGQVKTRES